MRKKKRLFIIVGSICIVALVAAIFLNYKMERIVKTLNRPGLVFSDPAYPPANPTAPSGLPYAPDYIYEIGGGKVGNSFAGPDLTEVPAAPWSDRENVTQDDIIQGVQNKVGRSIEKKDLIKAGLIIIRRLSWPEIEYMYETGSKPKISEEELKKVHEIIYARLTADEIKVMQELAHKYGKNLDFLSVPPSDHRPVGSR